MWGALITAVASLVGKAIDKAVPDRDQAEALKAQITAQILEIGRQELEGAVSIILAEARGGWLQRNWRPGMMVFFAGLVGAYWMGWTAPNLSEAEILGLFGLVKMGLGGYVIGRSVEKVADKLGGLRGGG